MVTHWMVLMPLLAVVLAVTSQDTGPVPEYIQLSPDKLLQIQALSSYLSGGASRQVDSLMVSSRTIGKACETQLNAYLGSLTNMSEWALTMLDATGRRESGLFHYNTYWEGRVNQCKQTSGVTAAGDVINGKHCQLTWLYPRALTAGLGVCVPSECKESDMFDIVWLYKFYNITTMPSFLPFSSNATFAHCSVMPKFTEDNGAIGAVSVLCLFAFIGIVGSLYDVITAYKRRSKRKLANSISEDVTGDQTRDLPVSTVSNGQVTTGQVNTGQVDTGQVNMAFDGEQKLHLHEGLNSFKGDVTSNSDVSSHNYNLRWREESKRHNTTPDVEQPEVNVVKVTGNSPKAEETDVCGSILLCFSVYAHMRKLASLEHARGSFRSLNAFRFLAMAWIVLGHSWQLGVTVTERANVENLAEVVGVYGKKISHEAIHGMQYSVETFFVLSAMLTTISFLKQVRRHDGKPPCSMFGLYYFHRYWRLTPVYMLIVMFYGTMWTHIGTGPNYPTPSADAGSCRTVWWKNLVYVQNLVEDGGLCMGWSWYLACDFQFYCMAPIFLSLLYWVPVAGIVMTSLGLCGNLVAGAYLQHGLYIRDDIENYWFEIYYAPWLRCGSYFVGMFLGYILYRFNFKANMNKIGVLFGWLISIAVISTIVYVPHTQGDGWPGWVYVLFYTVDRPVFAAAVSWMIFACITGYGGVINSVFSWVGWVPLGRLTYVGYLIHPILAYYTIYSSPVNVHVTDWIMIYYFLGNLALTLGASYVISAFLEVPFLKLEKVMFRNVKS